MSRFRIEFEVVGVPPKKDGANSLWNKPVEFGRLASLRRAALAAMAGHPLFSSDIRLELEVYASATLGDLDNFITGVCDGLQAAAKRTPIGQSWEAPAFAEIHPRLPVAILNDAAVVEIRAARRPVAGPAHYRIVLEGEA